MSAKPACSLTGCPTPVYAKDLCRTHYQRQYRHGDANAKYVPGSKNGSWETNMRTRYGSLDACPTCNAIAGNPCRDEPNPVNRVRVVRTFPHNGRPNKPNTASEETS